MIDTSRSPDNVLEIDSDCGAFGWIDRLRILFGQPVRQRLPIALWHEVEHGVVHSEARIPPRSGLTVVPFFSRQRQITTR